MCEVKIGDVAPDINAINSEGKPITLSSLKGKVVLINFTATWCGPCKKELPELIQVYNDYHHKGLEVISVFLDSDKDKVESYIKENKIPWPYSFDGRGWENKSAREWGISGVPTNPIVDKNGKISVDNARDSSLRKQLDLLFK